MSEELTPGAVCAVHGDRDATFTCTRCGTYGCDDCVFAAVVGREICRSCAAQGLSEPLPWEQRKQIGWWRAYWRTTKLVMTSPSATFRTPTTEEGVMGPVLFGAAAYTLGQATVLVLVLLMFLGMGTAMAVTTEEPAIGAVFAGYGLCMIPITLLQAPVYAVIGILFSGGLSHLTLVMLKKSRVGFEQTLRAVSYANAPHILAILSCVAPFWVIAAETVALRETHRCTTGTALFATVAWRLLFLLLIVGAYAAFIALVVMAAPSPR